MAAIRTDRKHQKIVHRFRHSVVYPYSGRHLTGALLWNLHDALLPGVSAVAPGGVVPRSRDRLATGTAGIQKVAKQVFASRQSSLKREKRLQSNSRYSTDSMLSISSRS